MSDIDFETLVIFSRARRESLIQRNLYLAILN